MYRQKQFFASKLVSTLEKNKKTTIVFTSSIKSDGSMCILSLASEKIKFIARIETSSKSEDFRVIGKVRSVVHNIE